MSFPVRLVLLPLFSILILIAEAQPLTADEATQIARSLGDKKILSDAGVKFLETTLSAEPEQYFRGTHPTEGVALMSKEGILWFCYAAFINEFIYRSGAMLPNRELIRDQRRLTRMARKSADDPEAYQQLTNDISGKEYSLSRKRFKGYLIEERIAAEDSISLKWRVLPLFGSVRQSKRGLVHKSRSTIGKTRTRTAREIFEIGLINERILNEIEAKLADSIITTEDEVFAFAAERAKYYNDYPRQRGLQLAFLDSLVKHDLLTPANRQSLIQSNGDNQLRTQFEILERCNPVVLLEAVHTNSLVENYNVVMQKIEQLIPGFHYSDLRVRRDTITTEFGPEVNTLVTFRLDELTYGHRFEYYVPPREDPVASVFARINALSFYPAVNSWLSDQGSPFRLYQASEEVVPESRWVSQMRYDARSALILLTEEQRRLWNDDIYFLSRENHQSRITSAKIRAAIDAFERIGLFSHLSKQQIDSCRMEALYSGRHSWTSLLKLFPDVIHIFDWETSVFKYPYVHHANAFSRIARGHFSISNAKDDFDISGKPKSKVHFSFDFNGKHYSRGLSFDGDWLDPEFLEFIRYALADNNVPGTYFSCYSGGQESGYIFLTRNQEEFIRTNYPEILSTE